MPMQRSTHLAHILAAVVEKQGELSVAVRDRIMPCCAELVSCACREPEENWIDSQGACTPVFCCITDGTATSFLE